MRMYGVVRGVAWHGDMLNGGWQADDGINGAEQFIQIERLGDIAVGAAGQAANHRLARGLGGQHNNRNVFQCRVLADGDEDVEAVGIRQS